MADRLRFELRLTDLESAVLTIITISLMAPPAGNAPAPVDFQSTAST